MSICLSRKRHRRPAAWLLGGSVLSPSHFSLDAASAPSFSSAQDSWQACYLSWKLLMLLSARQSLPSRAPRRTGLPLLATRRTIRQQTPRCRKAREDCCQALWNDVNIVLTSSEVSQSNESQAAPRVYIVLAQSEHHVGRHCADPPSTLSLHP